MQEVIENIKKKVGIRATEACGYSPMTMVISVSEIKDILAEVQNDDGCMMGEKITKPCEHCRNYEDCKSEKKDKCSSCGFVYPTKRWEMEQTEEYKFGYNKAIDDFVEKLCCAFCENSTRTEYDGIICNMLTLDNVSDLVVDVSEQLRKEN